MPGDGLLARGLVDELNRQIQLAIAGFFQIVRVAGHPHQAHGLHRSPWCLRILRYRLLYRLLGYLLKCCQNGSGEARGFVTRAFLRIDPPREQTIADARQPPSPTLVLITPDVIAGPVQSSPYWG